MKPADYGKWESLGTATLSPDGKWIAYDIRRVNGDNELRVSAASGGSAKTIAFCTGAAFSADSKWLGCEAGVSEAEADRLKKASKPAAQNKLQILELATGNVTAIDDVPSFAFSGDGVYVAFPHYGGSVGGGRGNAGGGRGGRGGGDNAERNDRVDPTGTTLTVRNLSTGVDTTFGNVTSFAWQDNGTNLAMTIGVEGRTGNAIQIVRSEDRDRCSVLDSGPAVFSALTWRKDSNDLAALRSVKQDGFEGESYIGAGVEESGRQDVGEGGRAAADRRLARAAVVGRRRHGLCRHRGVAEEAGGKKSDDDPATVEVWHWKDENVISEQKLTAARDRDRNVLRGVAPSAGGKLVPLSTATSRKMCDCRSTASRALALDGTSLLRTTPCSGATSTMCTRWTWRRARARRWRSI